MKAYEKIYGRVDLGKFISFCYSGDAEPALTGISYWPFPNSLVAWNRAYGDIYFLLFSVFPV